MDQAISHDEFFARLTELFSYRKDKDHGKVYLIQKRLLKDQQVTKPSPADPMPDLHPETPLPILIRATNGKSKERRGDKVRLSTMVEPAALEGFYTRYAEVCKAGMTGLKPRDRTKRKAKAKKKKGGPGQIAA